MTVLLVDLLLELLNELLLVRNDLRAGCFLRLDVLFESKIVVVSKSVTTEAVQNGKEANT